MCEILNLKRENCLFELKVSEVSSVIGWFFPLGPGTSWLDYEAEEAIYRMMAKELERKEKLSPRKFPQR